MRFHKGAKIQSFTEKKEKNFSHKAHRGTSRKKRKVSHKGAEARSFTKKILNRD